MKKTGWLLLLLITAFSATAQTGTTPITRNGPLRVEHGRIVNQYGIPPELKGISFSWSIWKGRKYYNESVVSWLQQDFKADIIRVAMAIQPDSGYLQFPALQQAMAVRVINAAVKKGMYVLIDWHDHNAEMHLNCSELFFAAMAKKYSGIPNVIYEIWNEPERVSWDTVKNYATQVIKIIRRYDRENLIVVGSPHWDQDVDVAALAPLTGFNNIAYSFHFYASDPSHQQSLRSRADKAISDGLPLFVTEWGVGEANGNGAFDLEKTVAWLNWLKQRKLSWTNWNLTDKRETTALLAPEANSQGSWNLRELTPAGLFIRGVLRCDKTKF